MVVVVVVVVVVVGCTVRSNTGARGGRGVRARYRGGA